MILCTGARDQSRGDNLDTLHTTTTRWRTTLLSTCVVLPRRSFNTRSSRSSCCAPVTCQTRVRPLLTLLYCSADSKIIATLYSNTCGLVSRSYLTPDSLTTASISPRVVQRFFPVSFTTLRTVLKQLNSLPRCPRYPSRRVPHIYSLCIYLYSPRSNPGLYAYRVFFSYDFHSRFHVDRPIVFF